MIPRLGRWFDDRLGLARLFHGQLRKVFPAHWSFLLGEVALYSFIVLVATGVYLTFFFEPSADEVIYTGEYEPLQGVEMSRAYASALRLSFSVRAGLVMRQMHHWAALVFLGAIVIHLARVFFTGAFRRPREVNWMIGLTMLLLALFNGFLGYSLLDDLLSGTGLRIGWAITVSVPVVGEWLAFLFFGGEFPNPEWLPRFYAMHILLVPVVLGVLLALHLYIVWRQKHTHFPGAGATEHNVVGTRLWPTYAAKSLGFFFLITGILAGMGGLLQINPIWLYGPFIPGAVSSPAQPDWYMGWVEGAIRLFPPWDFTIFGYYVSEMVIPAVVLPGVTTLALYLWPFLEARFTGDHAPHHLLDQPRDRPVRTAIGVGALTFYGLLMFAGSDDVLSVATGVPIETVVWWLRIGVLVVPVIVGWFTYALLSSRQAAIPVRRTDP